MQRKFYAPDFGALGDASGALCTVSGYTDWTWDSYGITRAAMAANAAGGGDVDIGEGKFQINRSISLVGMKNVNICGRGQATSLQATSDLDGSDATLRNDLFNLINNSSDPGSILAVYPSRAITIAHMKIDCSLQNTNGIPFTAQTLQANSAVGATTFTLPANLTGVSGMLQITTVGGGTDHLGIQSYNATTGIVTTTVPALFGHNAGDAVAIYSLAGRNLCAIEGQDVDFLRVENVRIIGAYGNGIVWCTYSPVTRGVRGCYGKDLTFENCVRGILPQYGQTGSVMQVGAALGVRTDNVDFIQCGGPLISDFYHVGGKHTNWFSSGWNGAPFGQTQYGQICSLESDFGAQDGRYAHITIMGGGGLYWKGSMQNNFFTQNPNGSPGPLAMSVEDLMIDGTALAAYTGTVAIPASIAAGNNWTNTTGVPLALQCANTGAPVITVNGAARSLVNSAATGFLQFALAPGDVVAVTSGTLTIQSAFVGPNLFRAAITLQAGSIAAGSGGLGLGKATGNRIRAKVLRWPWAVIQTIDVTRSKFDVYAEDSGEYVPTNAIYAQGSGIAGGGTQNCRFKIDWNETRATKTNLYVWSDDAQAVTNELDESTPNTNGVNPTAKGTLRVTNTLGASGAPSATYQGTIALSNGAAVTNPFNRRVLVPIICPSGTTITSVSVSGNAVPITDNTRASVVLDYNDTINVAWSGTTAPSAPAFTTS